MTAEKMRLALLWTFYVITCVIYLPNGVSSAAGAIAALWLVYPNSASAPSSSGPPTRHFTLVVVGLLLFPPVIFASQAILPLALQNAMQVRTAYGDFSILPSPLYLGLYVVPALVLLKRRARAAASADGVPIRWEHARLVLLSLLVILPACITRTQRAEQYAMMCEEISRSYCFYLFLKSFWYNGLWEELYYRGALLSVLTVRFRPRTAVLIGATVFTLHHVDLLYGLLVGTNPHVLKDLFGVFLLGVTCGYIYVHTHRLGPCIVYHGVVSGFGYLLAYLQKPPALL